MRKNTSRTPIRDALPAAPSSPSHSSTARIRARHAAGRGIATASSAEEHLVETMGQTRRNRATHVSRSGVERTQQRRRKQISANASSRSTASHQIALRKCENRKMGGVQYVTGRLRDCLSIIATSKVMSVRFSARHATPFLAGTRRRPTRSFYSKNMWISIAVDQPCHADTLLKIANAPRCEEIPA